MDLSILEQVGLTKTEIRIYCALLKYGQTTTTQVIRDAQINPSKIYPVLDKLIAKGLVTYVIKANKKHFSAANPEMIRELIAEKKKVIEEQETQVDRAISILKKIKKEGTDKINSQTYEGLRGVKSVYEKILLTLKRGETQYLIGAPKLANDQLEAFVQDWHKRRIQQGIKCKYIFQAEAKSYGTNRAQMKNTEVRYLPTKIISPVWIEIFGNYVMIGHIKKYNATVFLIHDEEIAKSYLQYFSLIWKQSQP